MCQSGGDKGPAYNINIDKFRDQQVVEEEVVVIEEDDNPVDQVVSVLTNKSQQAKLEDGGQGITDF